MDIILETGETLKRNFVRKTTDEIFGIITKQEISLAAARYLLKEVSRIIEERAVIKQASD